MNVLIILNIILIYIKNMNDIEYGISHTAPPNDTFTLT